MLNLNKTKTNSWVQRTDWWLPCGVGGVRQKMRGGDQKLQTSNYKISHEDVIYSRSTIFNTTVDDS